MRSSYNRDCFEPVVPAFILWAFHCSCLTLCSWIGIHSYINLHTPFSSFFLPHVYGLLLVLFCSFLPLSCFPLVSLPCPGKRLTFPLEIHAKFHCMYVHLGMGFSDSPIASVYRFLGLFAYLFIF